MPNKLLHKGKLLTTHAIFPVSEALNVLLVLVGDPERTRN